MSNTIDRIETAKSLMSSIQRSHNADMKEAIDLIANLVEFCKENIADPEDCEVIKQANLYLHGEP